MVKAEINLANVDREELKHILARKEMSFDQWATMVIEQTLPRLTQREKEKQDMEELAELTELSYELCSK